MKLYEVRLFNNYDAEEGMRLGFFAEKDQAERLAKFMSNISNIKGQDNYIDILEIGTEYLNKNVIKHWAYLEGKNDAIYEDLRNYIITGEKTNNFCEFIVNTVIEE